MSSNVISLSRRQNPKAHDRGALLHSFAKMRRDPNDVFWLKENAELLNILECSASMLDSYDLSAYAQIYDNLPKRLAFFPQYYRFFASIALDLEGLGLAGDHAETICARIDQQGLINAELSDLQRAETTRLLARRGMGVGEETDLQARLHRFINHSATFALPNHKVAYELTHIVFYLSEYGRRDPKISADAVQSLIFCGILAQLDQNTDLLAEVCIALRYAGKVAPQAWEDLVKTTAHAFEITLQDAGAGDNYHEYLVTNWAMAQMGANSFKDTYTSTGVGFYAAQNNIGALGAMSEILFSWDGPRSAQWSVMRRNVFTRLDDRVARHLSEIIKSTSEFEAFFEHFARASSGGSSVRAAQVHELARR